jgi:hypothetical protein
MQLSVINQYHYINVNVISEKRCILKVLITAVPMLNHMGLESSTVALPFGFLSKQLILLPILKLALRSLPRVRLSSQSLFIYFG